jgi:hypothetical protein
VRRPNRTIEIFSMSVLDLFASALGGFIMISIILFPNYMKQEKTAVQLAETQAKLKQTTAKLDRSEDSLRAAMLAKDQQSMTASQCEANEAALQQQLAAKDKQLASCQAALANTFVVVAVEWSESGAYDIDLHVTDPEGHEFYWAKNNRTRSDFPNTEAQLSYDNTRGPGVELWQNPRAEPGTYRIDYVYYTGSVPVSVKGNIFYRDGRKELPPVTLTATQRRRSVANVIVRRNGNVDIRLLP